MQVNFDEKVMRELVSKTIFDSLTPEAKEEIMRKAIAGLLKPDNDRYGSKTNMLEDALHDAARYSTRKIAEEYLANNEDFNQKVKGLFEDVSTKLFSSEVREKLVNKIADAVVDGLRPRDY